MVHAGQVSHFAFLFAHAFSDSSPSLAIQVGQNGSSSRHGFLVKVKKAPLVRPSRRHEIMRNSKEAGTGWAVSMPPPFLHISAGLVLPVVLSGPLSLLFFSLLPFPSQFSGQAFW